MTTHQTTAVLIPCLNEEQTIGKVVADFRRELPDAVIYVYDNASDDRTSQVAADAGAIVRMAPERGKGNVRAECCVTSMRTGMCWWTVTTPTRPKTCTPCWTRSTKAGDMVVGDRLSSTYFTENKRPIPQYRQPLGPLRDQ